MSGHLATTDDDLMDLASRFVYRRNVTVNARLTVNGKSFVVRNVRSDAETGLDAITVRNVATGEISVAFQGTAGRTDVITDALLVTTRTPAQFKAAVRYVDEMGKQFGPVASVSGNSLGGGLAAYVGVRKPSIRVVTVNPAPVPCEAAGLSAPNVRNYVTETDALYRAILAGGLRDRVLGDVITVKGSSFHLTFLGPNHVGSDPHDPDAPYDASMAVPFSLFHQDRVVGAGGFGDRVDVSVDNLVLMAAGLRHQRHELVTVLASELDETEQDLRRHDRELSLRIEKMGLALADEVDEGYAAIRRDAADLAREIEERLRRSVNLMPVAPLPLAATWRPWERQVLEAVRSALTAAGDVAAFGVRDAARAAWQGAWAALGHESQVITRALIAESVRLRGSTVLVNEKWSGFARLADGVADAVAGADEAVAAAIASRRCPAHPVRVKLPPWPAGAVREMKDDRLKQFHQTVVEIRQTVVGDVVVDVADALTDALLPVSVMCTSLVLALEAAELQLGTAVNAVRVAADAYSLTGAGVVVGLATGGAPQAFASALREEYLSFKATSDSVQEDVVRVRRAVEQLPDLVQDLRPYLEETFFSDTMIETAYDAFLKCRNLVERSEVAFSEVHHQLADHDARMVTALAERADDLSTDLATTAAGLRAMVS